MSIDNPAAIKYLADPTNANHVAEFLSASDVTIAFRHPLYGQDQADRDACARRLTEVVAADRDIDLRVQKNVDYIVGGK
jgi:hypothetical protein